MLSINSSFAEQVRLLATDEVARPGQNERVAARKIRKKRVLSALGKKIVDLREELGLAHNELARAALIDTGNLTRIISGQTRDPAFSVVGKIARALGVTLDYLYDEPKSAPRTWSPEPDEPGTPEACRLELQALVLDLRKEHMDALPRFARMERLLAAMARPEDLATPETTKAHDP